MSKRQGIIDYILLGAAMTGEIFEEIRLVGGLYPALLKERYGFVPDAYKRTSYLSNVSRLVSAGDLNKIVTKSGDVQIQLTPQGQLTFKKKFSLLALRRRKWDGFFMIVVFDIPEQERKSRDRLRDTLASIGFGMMQESVWISPYHFEDEVREFLKSDQLTNQAYVLYAKKLWAGDIKELVWKIWKLGELDREYKKIIRKLFVAKKLEGITKQKQINAANKQYLEILLKDPLLPKELLPATWPRQEVVQLLNSYLQSWP